MKESKLHIPRPNTVPWFKDGDKFWIGWCGIFGCKVDEESLVVTCKRCIKRREKTIREINQELKKG